MVIGLDGAHDACAGPLVELLLEDGAEVRICFEVREILDAPDDSRVVLLNAVRDAELLNLVRPVVSERRLRLLVWLRPGDRRELSRRARDFVDWMQESIDVPKVVPRYAWSALQQALETGTSTTWEGSSLDELIPGAQVLRPEKTDEDFGIEAMRSGPVVVHRAGNEEEVDGIEAMHRAAGGSFGLIWHDPAVLPARVTRIVARPLDWQSASKWLAAAGSKYPRLEAARLHLDPITISARAGRPPPPLPKVLIHETSDAVASAPNLPRRKVSRGSERMRNTAEGLEIPWWRRLHRAFEPFLATEDPSLIVRRPSDSPGFESLAGRIRAQTAPELHLVTGARGSGVGTEIVMLSRRLHESHCVVMLDLGGIDTKSIEPWELLICLGVAAVRIGRDRWGVRWSHELSALGESISRATGTTFDVDHLASVCGASAPDMRTRSTTLWDLPWDHSTGRADEAIATLASVDDIAVELARVLDDRETAMRVAQRAGLPRKMLPRFDTPLQFWSQITRDAEQGAIRGGIQAIIDVVTEMYPSNELFGQTRRDDRAGARGTDLRRSVELVTKELEATSGRRVVFVVEGVDRILLIEDLVSSLPFRIPAADLVLRAPAGMLEPPPLHGTFTRLVDIPVVDIDRPTEYGPGFGFFRELLRRRLANVRVQGPSIPDEILDRLIWGAGGRPGEFLSLLQETVLRTSGEPDVPLHVAVAAVLRDQRVSMSKTITQEGRALLEHLLDASVGALPHGQVALELYLSGALRVFPTPEGGHRVLPHPLLIEDLLRS